jgi:Kef-type K+ transport system membrane component KefB
LTDPNIADSVKPPEPSSLVPFFFAVGVATGVSFMELTTHPALAISLQPFVILGDMGIYSFFTWLFWSDMKLQFKNRLKKLRGTVGFRWAPTQGRA